MSAERIEALLQAALAGGAAGQQARGELANEFYVLLCETAFRKGPGPIKRDLGRLGYRSAAPPRGEPLDSILERTRFGHLVLDRLMTAAYSPDLPYRLDQERRTRGDGQPGPALKRMAWYVVQDLHDDRTINRWDAAVSAFEVAIRTCRVKGRVEEMIEVRVRHHDRAEDSIDALVAEGLIGSPVARTYVASDEVHVLHCLSAAGRGGKKHGVLGARKRLLWRPGGMSGPLREAADGTDEVAEALAAIGRTMEEQVYAGAARLPTIDLKPDGAIPAAAARDRVEQLARLLAAPAERAHFLGALLRTIPKIGKYARTLSIEGSAH